MERSRTQPPTSASRAVPLALAACAALAALGTPAAAQRADDERSAEEIFSFMKRRMDKNFDGLISESEWTRSARAFRRADVDRDGVISLSDVEASRAKRRGDARRRGTPAPESKPATPPAELDAKTVEFFESSVRPVLATHCYSCHSESASRIKGGLRVDSLEHLLKGGLGGPALVPGDPEASSLIEVVRYEDPMFAMPPKEKLPDDAIRDLERWVRMGAPWPAEAESPATEGEVVDTASGSE
ncbi:MAG: c-type cytochrome domain-containing protein, partial [Planctomycetota bacterium]